MASPTQYDDLLRWLAKLMKHANIPIGLAALAIGLLCRYALDETLLAGNSLVIGVGILGIEIGKGVAFFVKLVKPKFDLPNEPPPSTDVRSRDGPT